MARLNTSYTYDLPITADDVFAVISDPEFRTEACEAQGAEEIEVTVDEEGGGVTIAVVRLQDAAVPDFVKKFVGEKARVKQTERWSAPDAKNNRSADVTVNIIGQPAEMKGKATLKNTATGVDFTVTGDVKVAVPFLGKKLEQPIVDVIVASLDEEVSLGRKRL